MTNILESDPYKMMGARIRERREELRLTQDMLAEMTGITKSYISNIENGKQNCTMEILFVLCAALKTSMAALFQSDAELINPQNVTPEDARRALETIIQQWEYDKGRKNATTADVPADILKKMRLVSGGPNSQIDWPLIASILSVAAASRVK